MIYARAHDQTVAEDYFAAMQRVEQRLEIVPEVKQDTENEVVKVQEPTQAQQSCGKVLQLIEQLEMPELCLEERLGIVSQLRNVLNDLDEQASFIGITRQPRIPNAYYGEVSGIRTPEAIVLGNGRAIN
jgi:hypothetical protein